MPDRARVEAFIAMVESGHYVEAIENFYTSDASMQENLNPPRVGRDVLAEHERQALTRVKGIRTLPGSWFVMEHDRVVVHWVFEITNLDGRRTRLEELACQLWRGGRIFEERFYYDPGQYSVDIGPA